MHSIKYQDPSYTTLEVYQLTSDTHLAIMFIATASMHCDTVTKLAYRARS